MKKINFLLYQNLIESDFLLINSSLLYKKKNNCTIIKNQNFLDVFVINKEIKQFISLLKFIKKKQGLIKILDNNLEDNFFLFKDLKKNLDIDVSEIFLSKNTYNKNIIKHFKKTKLLLNLSTIKLSNNLIYSFFKHSFFLIQNINLYNSLFNLGLYKIFNDIQNYKNIIFISLLIKKI